MSSEVDLRGALYRYQQRKRRQPRRNDEDRKAFVDNDEGLYDLQRTSGLSVREWVRRNRALIDEVMDKVGSGTRPQHYLKYGGTR